MLVRELLLVLCVDLYAIEKCIGVAADGSATDGYSTGNATGNSSVPTVSASFQTYANSTPYDATALTTATNAFNPNANSSGNSSSNATVQWTATSSGSVASSGTPTSSASAGTATNATVQWTATISGSVATSGTPTPSASAGTATNATVQWTTAISGSVAVSGNSTSSASAVNATNETTANPAAPTSIVAFTNTTVVSTDPVNKANGTWILNNSSVWSSTSNVALDANVSIMTAVAGAVSNSTLTSAAPVNVTASLEALTVQADATSASWSTEDYSSVSTDLATTDSSASDSSDYTSLSVDAGTWQTTESASTLDSEEWVDHWHTDDSHDEWLSGDSNGWSSFGWTTDGEGGAPATEADFSGSADARIVDGATFARETLKDDFVEFSGTTEDGHAIDSAADGSAERPEPPERGISRAALTYIFTTTSTAPTQKTTWSSTSAPVFQNFAGSLRLTATYTTDLNDRNSAAFKNVSAVLCGAVGRPTSASLLVRSCVVNSIRQGSIIVDFSVSVQVVNLTASPSNITQAVQTLIVRNVAQNAPTSWNVSAASLTLIAVAMPSNSPPTTTKASTALPTSTKRLTSTTRLPPATIATAAVRTVASTAPTTAMTFSSTAAPTDAQTEPPALALSDESSGVTWWVWLVAAAGVLIIGVVGACAYSRRHRGGDAAAAAASQPLPTLQAGANAAEMGAVGDGGASPSKQSSAAPTASAIASEVPGAPTAADIAPEVPAARAPSPPPPQPSVIIEVRPPSEGSLTPTAPAGDAKTADALSSAGSSGAGPAAGAVAAADVAEQPKSPVASQGRQSPKAGAAGVPTGESPDADNQEYYDDAPDTFAAAQQPAQVASAPAAPGEAPAAPAAPGEAPAAPAAPGEAPAAAAAGGSAESNSPAKETPHAAPAVVGGDLVGSGAAVVPSVQPMATTDAKPSAAGAMPDGTDSANDNYEYYVDA